MGLQEASLGTGIPFTLIRYYLCLWAIFPISFLLRFIPGGPTGRHLYAAMSGGVLSYMAFGFYSNLQYLVPMVLGYGLMVLRRKHCGIISFVLCLGYIIGCDIYNMSRYAREEVEIDVTGPLKFITLKTISCAVNYNDGLIKEKKLRAAQKKNRLLNLPSPIEYLGYCLCCGSHFLGPVYEMKDYLDWTERKGIWNDLERGSPSAFHATLRAIAQAVFCMVLLDYLGPHFMLSRFSEPVYSEWGFLKRFGYQYMFGLTARFIDYFIWSITEALAIISGFGFSGWSNSSPAKPLWDRAKTVDILGLEFANSAVLTPRVWNIQFSTWLRHYVYDRLVRDGKRPGFFQLLVTQIVCALWHGLHPRYIIFFVQSAMMIAGSKALYRWQQASTSTVFKKLLGIMNFGYTFIVINYLCVGFMVLNLREILIAYRSVYYIGTILPIVVMLLGNVIKLTKPARSEAPKEE